MADSENRQTALQAAATVHSTACGYASTEAILVMAEAFLAWLEDG